MARQILPLAGAAVGSMFGPMGAQVGFAIGSLIGGIVDPIEIQGRKLGDAPTQVAAEGGARAIVFGKGCVRAVVLMERGGRTVKKQRARGGKGGPKQEGDERAFWTYAIGIGEAIPDGGLLRIWENEKLVYDVTPASQIVQDSTEFAKLFRFYDGSEDQLPDPAIEAIYTDPTDAPYYRGTAYMVFPQRDLTDFGEAVPTYRVEVSSETPPEYTYEYLAWSAGDQSGRVWTPPPGVSVVDAVLVVGGGGANGSGSGLSPTVTSGGGGGGEVLLHRAVPVTGPVTVFVSGRSIAGGGFKGGNTFFGDILARGGSGGRTTSSASGNDGFTGGGGSAGSISGAQTGGIGAGGIAGGDGFYADGMGAAGGGGGAGGSGHNGTVYGGGAGGTGIDASDIFPQFGDDGWFGGGGAGGVSNNSTGIGGVGGKGGGGNGGGGSPENGVDGCGGGAGGVDVTVSGRQGGQGGIYLRYILPGDEDKLTLAHVVSKLHDRCGHTASDYEVGELLEFIDGVVIESTQTGAEAINSIIGTHWADPADYDGKIRYIKRGAPVVRTLTIDDLIDEPETWQRNNAIEYPAKMHFFGQIADLAYASVKATSARYSSDVKVVGEVSVSSPETFSDSTRPYEIAAILHKILWTEAAGEVTWRVTDEHIDLVPTDCVGLAWAGQLWRARITQIESDPGELKLKMKLDRQSAYTANLTAIPVPPSVTPPQTSIVSDTALAVMDIPALVDAADDLHLVTAMSGETDAWAGAALQRSLDAGATFGTVSSSTLNAIMGTLQATVTAASPYYTDTTNVVEVELFTDDDIESISEQAFLSEGGAFALSWDDGGTQRWELMQYRDADMIAPKTYRLTTLHRGQLNTESAAHPAGAMFVLLDAAIQRQATQSAWIGIDLTHRAVSNGQTPDGADEQTLTYAGNSQREFPVAHMILSRAGDDVTATAVPRHRFGTDDVPIRSLNWDGYRWTATDGSNTIHRDGTAETETFDVTGWASPVTVTVAQINRITGAGPAVIEDIA